VKRSAQHLSSEGKAPGISGIANIPEPKAPHTTSAGAGEQAHALFDDATAR
jgi:hypothetical protein